MGVGFYYFTKTSSFNPFSTTNNGVTMSATFYDSNGNPIQTGQQTAVRGVPGLFYMSIQIKISNTGTANLTNIRINSSSGEMTNMLMNKANLTGSLGRNQNNILYLDTAKSCSLSTECGTGEVCVGSPSLCRLDISNFNGNKSFYVVLNADYANAYGTKFTVITPINLTIQFDPDEVVFRTDVVNGDYGVSGKQVVVDREGNGNFVAYTASTLTGTESYNPSLFITLTPQNNLVYKCGTSSQVCISQLTTLDKTQTYSTCSRARYTLGGTLSTLKTPVLQYKTDYSGGVCHSPCQERYSAVVSPPTQTCPNGVKEGTELCDTIDFGTDTCELHGFTGGTLTCSATCDAIITTSCTSGGGGANVKFRTSDLAYGTTSAIAFNSSCSGALEDYGYSTGFSNYYGNCLTTVNARVSGCGTATQVLSGLPGGWLTSYTGTELWSCSDKPGYLYVCNTISGTESDVARYYDTDTDAGNVVKSKTPTGSKEATCTS